MTITIAIMTCGAWHAHLHRHTGVTAGCIGLSVGSCQTALTTKAQIEWVRGCIGTDGVIYVRYNDKKDINGQSEGGGEGWGCDGGGVGDGGDMGWRWFLPACPYTSGYMDPAAA